MINGTIMDLYVPNTRFNFHINNKTLGHREHSNVKMIGTMEGSYLDKMMYVVIFEDGSELLVPNDIAIVHYMRN